MQHIKRIVILENYQERDAEIDNEKELAERSFPSIPVECWYGFYRQYASEQKIFSERLRSYGPDHLLITFTTLANGPASGYGDILGMWVRMLQTIPGKNQSLNICVGTNPMIHWQLMKWVEDCISKTKRADRLRAVISIIKKHNIYSMAWGDTDFEKEAVPFTLRFWQDNYIPKDSTFVNKDGLACKVFSIYPSFRRSDPAQYSICVPIPGKPEGYHTMEYIDLESLKKLNPKKPPKNKKAGVS